MWYFLLAIIAVFFLPGYLSRRARRKEIYRKYGYTGDAERIISKTLWVGETTQQLVDSLGWPIDKDEKVLKTKRKEIWKYYSRGVNRYGLRVTIEEGVVVGWDEKLWRGDVRTRDTVS